jgi:MraZ protein
LSFRGHYEHSLDAKHRLSVPARFRAAYSSGLVLAKDADACISVWTPDVHEATVERTLAGRNPFSAEVKKLRRYFEANSFETELDSSGRVTLPSPLLEHANVEKEVVVAGVGDHLEIWSRERWQEEQRELDASIEEVTQSLGNLA